MPKEQININTNKQNTKALQSKNIDTTCIRRKIIELTEVKNIAEFKRYVMTQKQSSIVNHLIHQTKKLKSSSSQKEFSANINIFVKMPITTLSIRNSYFSITHKLKDNTCM